MTHVPAPRAQFDAHLLSMLNDGEQIVALVEEDQRFISVTTSRVFLHEKSAPRYLVVRRDSISAVQVNRHPDGQMYLEFHFGGGLSRTVSTSTDAEAAAIVNAVTRP